VTPSREEQKIDNFAAYDYHDDLDCSKRLRHYFFSYVALPNRIDGNRWESINFFKKFPYFYVPWIMLMNFGKYTENTGNICHGAGPPRPLNYKFCGLPTPLG
jgi:hypothetical protein